MKKCVISLLCGALALCVALPASCIEYRIRELDAPAWATSCTPLGINASGQIVGQAQGSPGPQSGVIWDAQGNYTVLNSAGVSQSFAHDINDAGQVVGSAVVESGFFGQTTTRHCAVRWDSSGNMQLLADLDGAAMSWALQTNNNGDCAGFSIFERPYPDGDSFDYEYHLVTWDSTGDITDHGIFGPAYDLRGFNDSGVMAFNVGSGGHTQVQLRSPDGQFHDWPWTMNISDLNDLGQGCASVRGEDGHYYAAYCDGSSSINQLQTLSGAYHSFAEALNDSGLIVGYSSLNGSRACLWTKDGAVTDLGTLAGDTRSSAYGVNNRGVIVGTSDHGRDRPVVWEPVPEPSTLVALAGCFAGFCSVCRRRGRRM